MARSSAIACDILRFSRVEICVLLLETLSGGGRLEIRVGSSIGAVMLAVMDGVKSYFVDGCFTYGFRLSLVDEASSIDTLESFS